mmetsp:Transcript_18892/g.43385  ORF Transcript_18892/g.43385 Transcript_18892/m.43385 type:complete len:92 (+) Transcript_18892:1175-1450(+)
MGILGVGGSGDSTQSGAGSGPVCALLFETRIGIFLREGRLGFDDGFGMRGRGCSSCIFEGGIGIRGTSCIFEGGIGIRGTGGSITGGADSG